MSWSLFAWLGENWSGSMSAATRRRNGLRSKLSRHSMGWNEATSLIRDRDAVYGEAVTRRLRAMRIRDKPITPGSPWQNSFAERMIGTIRPECVDHVVVLGERHLRWVLKSYGQLLQHGENASIIEHGCARFTPGPTDRTDRFVRHSRRAASPIDMNLGFRHAQSEGQRALIAAYMKTPRPKPRSSASRQKELLQRFWFCSPPWPPC